VTRQGEAQKIVVGVKEAAHDALKKRRACLIAVDAILARNWLHRATALGGAEIRESTVKILFTILGCLIIAVVGGFAFIYSGIYDVSATTPDNAFVAWAIHVASDHSVGARLSTIKVPPGLDQPQQIQAGGHLFAQHCAVCHGGPGLKETAIALGLNPQPPDLFRASRVPASDENFQFIKYGVKMTAMPGFGPTQTDEQLWALVAFLGKAPGMSVEDFATQTGISVSAAAIKPGGG
jgi:mono/diheme cytochrome c family protein